MKVSDTVIQFLADYYELSDIEINLYVSLLKRGPSTIMDLANFADVNRATTHINVETLIKKGFVVQSKMPNSKRRVVIAEDPKKLRTVLNNKKLQLEKAEIALPDIITNLQSIAPSVESRSDIEIEYFENKSEVKNIYKKVLQADEIRSYVNLDKIINIFPDNSVAYIEAHKRNKNMKIWAIISADVREADEFSGVMDPKRYKSKIIKPEQQTAPVDFLIFDDKIAYITVEDSTKGVILKNKYIVEHSVSIFNLLWSLI